MPPENATLAIICFITGVSVLVGVLVVLLFRETRGLRGGQRARAMVRIFLWIMAVGIVVVLIAGPLVVLKSGLEYFLQSLFGG
jgi:hypothetical protein